MDARELRIGSWVSHNDEWNGPGHKGYFQWSESDWYAIGECTLFLENVTPIPLSPELLERCGFKYDVSKGIASFDEDQQEGDTHYWDLRVKGNGICDSFTLSIVRWGDESEPLTFSNHWLRVRLTNLHQLQNVYFALTGEELQVKMG